MPAADSPPAPRWPDVALQLGQSLITTAATLTLYRWGAITGATAAWALGIAGAPAVARFVSRLRASPSPPPGLPPSGP